MAGVFDTSICEETEEGSWGEYEMVQNMRSTAQTQLK